MYTQQGMWIFLGHVMTNGHVRRLLCIKIKPENENEEEASITNGISNDVTYVSQISEFVEQPRGRYVFQMKGDDCDVQQSPPVM